MTTPTAEGGKLLELADRVDAAGCDLVCPLCGEPDFDVPGLSHHIISGCDVADLAIWLDRNADVSGVLRDRAHTKGADNA